MLHRFKWLLKDQGPAWVEPVRRGAQQSEPAGNFPMCAANRADRVRISAG